MKNLRKQWKLAIILIMVVIVAQAAVSVAVRTRRMHGFLVEQLERSFGRPVEVDYFSAHLLPMPELDAQRVTIGEDPAFGNEYFLRAEHLGASLRWRGLLRGHFEFGTVSLDRPSLILARNQEGKWNLEQWLPPENQTAGKTTHFYGPQPPAMRGNFLRKINVDEGRINFKIADEKLPFAFTSVTGSVEQIASGRWQLQLEAQPWRSGVQLQSTGIVRVAGDIAGTSSRLRPAEIKVHWDKVSLADLFRMVSGADLGVRGEFALDATAKSGPFVDVPDATVAATPQDWTFALAARGTRIHRWNLTDREDNPGVNVNMNGRWNSALGTVFAKEVTVETAKSNLRGAAKFSGAPAPFWEWEVDSAGIQAMDLLAWYRAFHGGVAEGVSAEQFFTGTMRVSGWPVVLQSAAFSSTGGALKFPGLEKTLRIGATRGGKEKDKFIVEPVTITMDGEAKRSAVSTRAPMQSVKRRTTTAGSENEIELAMIGDLAAHAAAVTVTGHVEEIADTLKITSALGKTLNHGWELKGAAAAAMRWEWKDSEPPGQWSGTITVTGGELEAVGLNLPVRMEDVRLEWKDGKRGATVGKVGLLGANWSGEIGETRLLAGNEMPRWNFKLHADHLNATELDRWIGPRARPGWLSNLLPSLLRDSTPKAMPTELLRRVDAEGEMRVDELTIERLKLANLRAQIAMRDLRLDVKEAQAEWAGGTVRGKLLGVFAPAPKYEIAVELQGVNLAQIPAGRLSDDFAGSGFATLQLRTEGVGREQLLQKLTGKGKVRLVSPEFHGWNATAKESAPLSGISRWTSGEGGFSIGESSVQLDGLQLESAGGRTIVRGAVSFAREANLRMETKASGTSGERTTAPAIQISGPLEAPKVTYENLQAKKSAD
jgi:hypothetical protein